jgi:hypothetical protein
MIAGSQLGDLRQTLGTIQATLGYASYLLAKLIKTLFIEF